MTRGLVAAMVLLLVVGLCAGRASANLNAYVTRPQSEFRWTKESENQVGNVKVVTLKVRSQVWRGIPWDHSVQLFLPKTRRHPKTGLLLITGGNPGITETALGASLAPRLEAPLAIVYNTPNQPLFDGKKEDDLIAHTFEEFLKTGDETWPLLFPMVRGATSAMDALQQYTARECEAKLERFVVTGASKRGWTTYLTAAADRRVAGIAPMVFDNLNFNAQMPRQLELWGKYSEQIDDYSRRGLQQKMSTPRGKQLVSLVDPWFYRKQLKMPKLLIHGANDRYWATDSTRIYWDDLEGEKCLLSVPNSGHGLEDRTRVVNSITAFFHAVATGRPMPRLVHRYEEREGKVRARVTSDVSPREVRLWTARAMDLDFRPVKWESVVMPASGNGYETQVDGANGGGLAVFVEAEYEVDGRRFTLSTPTAVYGKRPAVAAGKD
jgi:PhoPQ-activated pathogenicity-related protein